MQIHMLKSKIYRATVTDSRMDYEGSITIDTDLMKAAGLEVNEKVLVANFRDGQRFETYVIPGPKKSGTICINGAAAHLARPGDEVIVMSFCSLSPKEAKKFRPKVIHLDKENRVLKVSVAQAGSSRAT